MKKMYNKPFVLSLTMVMLGLTLITACKKDNDYTVDTSNPVVVSYNPAPTVEGVAVGSNLVMTFNKQIKKGAGAIVIASKLDTQRISMTSAAVTLSPDKLSLIITPPNHLSADVIYTVTPARGLVTDLLGNQYMGLPDKASWTFKTVGTSGIPLVSLSPLPASTSGSIFKLDLVFASNVNKGTGNFSVYEAATNTKIADIAVTGSQVVVNGNRVTVKMASPLKFATNYYVLADVGTFVDANGKAFQGFLTPTSWAFTTASGSGTSLIAWLPLNNDLSDISGNTFDAMQGDRATANVTFITDPDRGRVASFVSGSYAQFPKHDLLRPALTQSFSFSMWVKLAAVGSDPVLLSNSNWNSGGNPGFVFGTDGALTYTGVAGSSGKGWLVKLTGDASGASNRMDWRANEAVPSPAPPLADNKWHMVTAVIDQTNKRLHIYFDATEYITPAGSDLSILKGPLWDKTNDYPFTIWEDGTGAYNSGSSTRKALSGLVDDIRIYNKALSAGEVTGIYLTK